MLRSSGSQCEIWEDWKGGRGAGGGRRGVCGGAKGEEEVSIKSVEEGKAELVVLGPREV